MVLDHTHLQFSTSLHWQSAIIRKLCHSPFSHVDLVLEDGNLLGASDYPEVPVLEGNPRGVAVRPTEYQLFGIRRMAIIKTPLADRIIELLRSQLGVPFDASALTDFMSDEFPGSRDWRADNLWFCSELIVWAFEEAGYWGSGGLIWPKNRITPTDLLMIFMRDENFVNENTFWEPIPGVKRGARER
jgi:hypothetical protein